MKNKTHVVNVTISYTGHLESKKVASEPPWLSRKLAKVWLKSHSHQMVSCFLVPSGSFFSCPWRPTKVWLFSSWVSGNFWSVQKAERCPNGGRIWDCIMNWTKRQVTQGEEKPWRETGLKQIYTQYRHLWPETPTAVKQAMQSQHDGVMKQFAAIYFTKVAAGLCKTRNKM